MPWCFGGVFHRQVAPIVAGGDGLGPTSVLNVAGGCSAGGQSAPVSSASGPVHYTGRAAGSAPFQRRCGADVRTFATHETEPVS